MKKALAWMMVFAFASMAAVGCTANKKPLKQMQNKTQNVRQKTNKDINRLIPAPPSKKPLPNRMPAPNRTPIPSR